MLRATLTESGTLAQQHPKIDALEAALQELRRAPLLQKTAAAERVAELSLAIVGDHELRLERLERPTARADEASDA